MNRIPIYLLLVTGLLLFCPQTPASATAPLKTSYYWFTFPSDQFNDYATISAEEQEWWYYFDGILIDQNPTGGTLIARGYLNGNSPHTVQPSVFLYAHFWY